MKKRIFLCLAVILIISALAACGSDDGVIEIGERIFLNRITDIVMHPEQYFGRTIQLEGMFWIVAPEGVERYFVARYALICCGADGIVGFELDLDGTEPLPDDAWAEVVGVLERAEEGAFNPIRLRVVSLTEMDERGAEMVS